MTQPSFKAGSCSALRGEEKETVLTFGSVSSSSHKDVHVSGL